MKKKAYAIQMSYDISDKEKMLAEKALISFEHLLKELKKSKDYLNLIHSPLKENANISPEKVFENRADLREYRDEVLNNFNLFKASAFNSFILLQPFMSDTQTAKINKSFVVSIGDLEKQVNRFASLFSDLKSKDFTVNIVKSIDLIKKEVAQLEQIIEDRIISHVQKNILARNWIDNVSKDLQKKVEDKIPLSSELMNEQEEKLKYLNKIR